MKLIVLDLDKLGLSTAIKKYINERKVCTLNRRDLGKKTLMALPRGDPEVLKATREYGDAIFKLKDDNSELKWEDKFFRKVYKKIKWFRIGIILRREKAVKILLKLLER